MVYSKNQQVFKKERFILCLDLHKPPQNVTPLSLIRIGLAKRGCIMKVDIIELEQDEEAPEGSESEQRFEYIFNAVNDGIFIIDPNEYCIVEANPKAV